MLEQMGKAAREAFWHLAQLSTEQKSQALLVIADLLGTARSHYSCC